MSIFYGEQSLTTSEDDKQWLTKQIVRLQERDKSRGFNVNVRTSLYAQIAENIYKTKMTKRQIVMAIDNFLQTYEYPDYSAANVTNFNKIIKTYNHKDVYNIEGKFPSSNFPKVKFPDGTEVWVSKHDAARYDMVVVADYNDYP